MKKTLVSLGVAAGLFAGSAMAVEGPVPQGVNKFHHVFLIMMENHYYPQIIGNPNAPFINSLANQANLATNYFAIAHPSLTNYLEVVGGSNFGVLSDNNSDWHNTSCTTNLASATSNTDAYSNGAPICPISGTGADAATPVVDTVNETSPPDINAVNEIDGVKSLPALTNVSGKTIADQLVAAGKTWKSYQENLPVGGPDGVNYSDGVYSNLSTFTGWNPAALSGEGSGAIVKLYAAKHNPFVYFANIQEGANPELSFNQIAGFDGVSGLYADLASGHVPNFSFIVPNQCNDQHGTGNGNAFCAYDPGTDGTQATLNPALIQLGDNAVNKLVTSIKASEAWKQGNNAIVVVWDENDYSGVPNTNQVALIVETSEGKGGLKSNNFYTHFSLLKTLESAFRLPCLNNACNSDVKVISDLFTSK